MTGATRLSLTWPGIAAVGAREFESIPPEGFRQVEVVTAATPMRDVVGSGGPELAVY